MKTQSALNMDGGAAFWVGMWACGECHPQNAVRFVLKASPGIREAFLASDAGLLLALEAPEVALAVKQAIVEDLFSDKSHLSRTVRSAALKKFYPDMWDRRCRPCLKNKSLRFGVARWGVWRCAKCHSWHTAQVFPSL